MAETFAEFGAVQDFGFDIDPATAMETLWWAPGAWVASAAASGINLPLMSCGARWLDTLPQKYSGRSVATLTVEESIKVVLDSSEIERFVKLPEAKVDSFPASLHTLNRHWETTVNQYHLPPDALIQIQMPVDFVAEWRFWIAHGEVVAGSWYRVDDLIWGSDDWTYANNKDSEYVRAESVAATVAADPDVATPPGYVLDIGLTADGRWIVVEANAAWSSGPYDGDPVGIVKAIEASHDFEGEFPQWAWQPQGVFGHVGALRVHV